MEFVLVLPLLSLLVFGMIEFGMAYNARISVTQSAREGARLATVGGTASYTANFIVSQTKQRTSLDTSKTKVHLKYDGTTVGDDVHVCVAYPTPSITGLIRVFMPSYVKSVATMRLEQTPYDSSSGTDADPTGQGWSWCG